MKGKIHADELAFSGGSRVAIAHGALSADHLEALPEEGIEQFRGAVTMPTGLPGTSFFLNMRFARPVASSTLACPSLSPPTTTQAQRRRAI